MAKDILLYGTISQYNAMFFFDQINEAIEANEEEELVVRVNCDGGDPGYGMEMIRKIQELGEQVYLKIGMSCHSMAFFMPCYLNTDNVECIDSTLAVLHRGAYSEWLEKSPSFPGSMFEQILIKCNKDLEKALRAKVDVALLESLPQFKDKGITLKDVFSLEDRVEVLLTASDLKKIGLVSKVTKIAPSKQAAISAQMEAFNKCTSLSEFKIAAKLEVKNEIEEPIKNVDMTRSELREKHPTIYAEVIQEGITQERDRVEGIMVFNEIDPAGVKAAIESGKQLTSKQTAEFALKSFSLKALNDLEKDSTKDTLTTDEVKLDDKTTKEKELGAFEASVQAKLNLKK